MSSFKSNAWQRMFYRVCISVKPKPNVHTLLDNKGLYSILALMKFLSNACSLSVSMHVLKKEDTSPEMSAISSKTYKKNEKVCRLLNEQEVHKATELMVFDKSAGVNTGGFEASYNMSALFRVSSESLWAQGCTLV